MGVGGGKKEDSIGYSDNSISVSFLMFYICFIPCNNPLKKKVQKL